MKEIIIGQGVISLIIISISLYLVFYGFGYKVDWQHLRLKQTGIISLSFVPKDASVNISGSEEKSGVSSPFEVAVLPGNYEITVKKADYTDWQATAKIEKDKIYFAKNISLFKQSPEINILTDQSSIDLINAPYDDLVKNPQGDLIANQYEIWNGKQLITRFSTAISNVIWYPGMEYIAYQQGDEIRLIEKNGTNDQLLVKLSSSAQTKFIFSWDGTTLLYKDGNEYKKAEIT